MLGLQYWSKFICSVLLLFVSEHNLWYHVYGYGGPEEQLNCVRISTAKCHICKHPENSCYAMEDHDQKEHNRAAHILSRNSGKNHFVLVMMRSSVTLYVQGILIL